MQNDSKAILQISAHTGMSKYERMYKSINLALNANSGDNPVGYTRKNLVV